MRSAATWRWAARTAGARLLALACAVAHPSAWATPPGAARADGLDGLEGRPGKPPADQMADKACAVGPATAQPKPQELDGCAEAVCTAAGEQLLCACKTGRSWHYQRRAGKQVLQRWPTAVSPMTGPGAFELRQADLAGDGQTRWLVARWLGTSNGLGVSSHELCVLDPSNPSTRSAPSAALGVQPPTSPSPSLPPPVCRVVSEWQALSVLVQEAGQKMCSLMDSRWQSGQEPGRGQGTYAVGRLWRWQDEHWQMVPMAQRQAVARRLLPTFMNQRESLAQSQSAAGTLWYQHPGAQAVACPGPLCAWSVAAPVPVPVPPR